MEESNIGIKKIIIEGFKRFNKFELEFNLDKTIIVGDNGSGKSTILEAIDLVLNHSSKTFDLSLLPIYFNLDMVHKFEKTPSQANLPYIRIQIFFSGMDANPAYSRFYGPNYFNNSKNNEEFGVQFEAKFDNSLIGDLSSQILERNIPYEYYEISINTFGNVTYYPNTSSLFFCLINISSNGVPTLSQYSKQMFKLALEPSEQVKIKNKFSIEIKNAMDNTMKDFGNNSIKFSTDYQKSSLENIISIYEDELPISSVGQGRESIIKTKMLIDNHKKATIIAIEEPENHLSHSSLSKMINLIQKDNVSKQFIITSHSSRIATGIGLDKVIIISPNSSENISLKNLNTGTSNYFRSLPSDNLLYFILSKKIILVEGPSELVYMNYFYKKIYKKDLESDDICCISVNGLSFKHYVQVANILKKKISIITDNDNDIEKVKNFSFELKSIYSSNPKLIDVFYDKCSENRTFEICLYNCNEDLIKSNLEIDDRFNYNHKYANGNKYLGKMLNNKTETALELVSKDISNNLVIPTYIKDALEFIHND